MLSKVTDAHPSTVAFLKDAEYFSCENGKQFDIYVKNEFMASMINRPDVIKTVREAALTTGLFSELPVVQIKTFVTNDNIPDISDLGDIGN